MSETMSSPSRDWAQFYQYNLSTQSQTRPAALFTSNQLSEANTNITNATSGPSGSIQEGRIAKPIRKRSRASRRTPPTLLSTDTSNFRAMVQQFTGGPIAPFASNNSPYTGGQNFNFGLRTSQIVNPNPITLPRTGYNVMQLQQQRYQQLDMLPMNNGGDLQAYLNGLQASRGPVVAVSGGVEGVSSAAFHDPPVRSASSNKNLSQFNYMS